MVLTNNFKTLEQMKDYKDLLQDYQDLLSEINHLGNQDYSLDNHSEIVNLRYLANIVENLIDLHNKEEFNKIYHY